MVMTWVMYVRRRQPVELNGIVEATARPKGSPGRDKPVPYGRKITKPTAMVLD